MIEVKDGVFYKEGKPFVFISADYPYYRDHPSNWENRLDTLKAGGIDVVTFYVPWRHHHLQLDGEVVIDFIGDTQGNRNVRLFLELIQQKNMYAVVKPGPFIHAETDFGGLPDFVEGGKVYEAMLDNQDNEREWHKVLPAPFDPKFEKAVCDWFKAVDDEVIHPYTYPEGPVIALQILNEGLYSDGQHSVLAYDYSKSGLNYHFTRLEEKYGSIENYNTLFKTTYLSFQEIPIPRKFDLHEKKDKSELNPYLEWSETQNQFLGELYKRWGNAVDTKLPVFNNINPPLDETKGFDFWLTRVVPEHWNVHYGFTNWIGVVSHDETAFLRYLLLVKRSRGINLEENWGFSKLYDWRYKYHHIPFYQTVLAMALGATGFNVYTGVSTSEWDEGLDSMQAKPYPDCSPISETGETGEKYEALKLLINYLKENEECLMLGKRTNEATWGLYNPYNYLASYGNENKDYHLLGEKAPKSGFHGLESFMQTMLHDQREFGMVNLETTSLKDLLMERHLVVLGSFFMHEGVQQKLISYVEQGGKLFYFGELPKYNEYFAECSILSKLIQSTDRFFTRTINKGKVIYYPENPFTSGGISKTFSHLLLNEAGPSRLSSKDAYTFLYEHGNQKVVFILSTSQFEKEHEVMVDGELLKVTMPAKGCSIVTLDGRKIKSCLVKGINDYDQSSVIPTVMYKDDMIKGEASSDMFYSGIKEFI